MKTYFKIYQLNQEVAIQDPRTQSVYNYDLSIQLDQVEYPTRTDALQALTVFINGNPDDDGEYTILEMHRN